MAGIPTSAEDFTGLSKEELKRLGYAPKSPASTALGGTTFWGKKEGTRRQEDMTAEEAARSLILQGAKDRTSAADRAADRFRGLEDSERARASQAAGQLLAQATGGATGGAALAAGQAAGRQAASQYSEIAGRAAKDIFAAESAAGERRMDEAEIMKGTTLTGERGEKISALNADFLGIKTALDDGALEDSEAIAMMQQKKIGESDPEVIRAIDALIGQLAS